jgi:acid phosphatase family membrane protein YuiD
MSVMGELASNSLLITGALAWLTAQLIKLVISLVLDGKITFSLFWRSGGMPSSHASLVCAVTVSVAKLYGLASPVFGMALFISFIVIFDALGVRRQTGEHAKALNQLVQTQLPEPQRKAFHELTGHTPLQVFMGALLGCSIGILMPV